MNSHDRISVVVVSAILGLAILGVAPSLGVAALQFSPYKTYNTGANPWSIAIGDLNGDGKPDLVTGSTANNTVSVLLNSGSGMFGARTDFPTGEQPRSVAIGDLNGDGKLDVATPNASSNSVSVLLGNGNGTLEGNTDYATGLYPYSVAIGDFNGDSKPDLAAATGGPPSIPLVSVLLGNGDGTFEPRSEYGTGSGEAWSVAVGDLNTDGKQDLVVARGPYFVSVLLGNGDGTFGTNTDYSVGSYPYSVAIGDLNADGKPDLVVANEESHTVSVLLGYGDGTFGPKADYSAGLYLKSVAIGDLNGDGYLDLATGGSNSSVSILLGNGDGTLGPKTDYIVGGNPFSVAIADLNGDGKPDLATANPAANTASVLLNASAFDRPPAVSVLLVAMGIEGSPLALFVAVTDPDGDAITSLTATGTAITAGAVFTAGAGNTSGTLNWTPMFTQSGSYAATFTASNALSGSASTAIAVANVDQTPAVTAPASPTVSEGVLLTFAVTAADPDGDAITGLAAAGTALAAGGTFAADVGNTSGAFSWTPSFTQAGTYEVTFTASNALSASATTAITVANVVQYGPVTGRVTAQCPAPNTGLLGVFVDAYAVGAGTLAASATTDETGNYVLGPLEEGTYEVTVVAPLGYVTSLQEQQVTITSTAGASANFSLSCLQIAASPRAMGYWKHQVGVGTGGKSAAQVSAAMLCSYLDLIEQHFNSNAVNEVAVYIPPTSGLCTDKLLAAKPLLNLQGSVAMVDRARQQLTALLLNAAAGYIGLMQPISADGATVSQAITHCDNVIDSPAGDYEKAKTIADYINNGTSVPAGAIPLNTALVAYRQGMEAVSFRVTPNPGRATREFRFVTGARGPVSLALYDVSGRLVSQIYRGDMDAGAHSVRWGGKASSGATVARGLYFARLQTPRESPTIKVLQLARE